MKRARACWSPLSFGGRAWRPVAGARLAATLLALPLLAGATHRSAEPAHSEASSLDAVLRGHVETLSSPAFGGRRPGTEGETQTLHYLVRQWFGMGLESGTNLPGSPWFAPVDLIARAPVLSRASFMRGRHHLVSEEGEVFVYTSGLRNLVEGAPVLFVGHGTIPARTELAGRVALVLDTPASPAAGMAGGTAAGRGGRQGWFWRRKSAGDAAEAVPPSHAQVVGRLLDAGAMAVITVLDGERTLADVAARRRKAGYSLAGERVDNEIEAFVTPELADRLLGGSAAAPGAALAAWTHEADQDDFVPRVTGASVTLEATSTQTRVRTHNLIGRIPGRHPEAGAVVLMAHWDHFGVCDGQGRICSGAVDNASGLAAITEVARQIVGAGPQHQLDRDVYVVATTGEELGLLGAQAFAENPPLPLDRIVAAFNVDSTGLVPPGGPVAIVGRGMTGIDGEVARVLAGMRRRLVPEEDEGGAETGPNAYVRRQDSWALIQHDVPAMMVSNSYADPVRLGAFMAGAYHTPADTPDKVDYAGLADDVRINTELVRDFADLRRYPGHAGRDGAGRDGDKRHEQPQNP